MLYRSMKGSPDKLSILGFGCMRLPLSSEDPADIDQDQFNEMLHYAIDNGVNYVDTAWPYHNEASEPAVGRALSGSYRDKVFLATKLPTWLIESREDMDFYLNEQLKRLQTDHIDYYLVHALTKTRWKKITSHDVFDFLDSARKDGRIRHAGFSFHDELSLFKEIADSYDWDFCQIQYNYMDENYQAGKEGLDYAADKGLGIIVMEPLRGGHLAGKMPKDLEDIWQEHDSNVSPAGWGLRWVWDHEAVTVVLSGMSNFEQVKDNIANAEKGTPGNMSEKDLQMISRVRSIFRDRMRVPCTNCRYCMPCPAGVNIPECFNRLNIAYMFEDPDFAKATYKIFTRENGKASLCVECGKCEEVCPQQIAIRDNLKEVVEKFESE